ncbi:hypothetical protein GCM10017750_56820 [Streptomyces racemochromogenes]
MTPVRLAIVGCGAAARGCHLPALPPLKGDVQLTALIDRDPRQAEAALALYRELGGTDAEQVVLATDPAEAADAFDAAVVVAPHTLHAPIVEALLAAGKHVLLEKPMTTSVEDARRLARTAAAEGAPVLAMAHPRRLFPAYAWIKRLIDAGELGEVVRVDWSEGHPYAHEPVSWSMFDRRLAGGGVLTDTASHVFDTLLWWLGPDVEVVRAEDNSLGGVETDAHVRLRFGTTDVTCDFSRLRDLGISCTVTGTRATVTIGTDFPAGECTLVTADGVELHRGDVPAQAPAQDEWEGLFSEQLANFAAAVRGTAAVHSTPPGRRPGGRADPGVLRRPRPRGLRAAVDDPGPGGHGRVRRPARAGRTHRGRHGRERLHRRPARRAAGARHRGPGPARGARLRPRRPAVGPAAGPAGVPPERPARPGRAPGGVRGLRHRGALRLRQLR